MSFGDSFPVLKMQMLKVNTMTCRHRTHSRHLTQMLCVNRTLTTNCNPVYLRAYIKLYRYYDDTIINHLSGLKVMMLAFRLSILPSLPKLPFKIA